MVSTDFLSNIPFKDVFKHICVFWRFLVLFFGFWHFFVRGRVVFLDAVVSVFFFFNAATFFCFYLLFSINADSYIEVLQADKKCYFFQMIVLPLGKVFRFVFLLLYVLNFMLVLVR